jgi:ADP-ribosyl-[dinitrogen reductase] hydrolase
MSREELRALELEPPPWTGRPDTFPVPEPGEDLRARYLGCLLGGAAGDALGRPAEGWTREALQVRYPARLRDFVPWRGWRSGPVGTFTDDTQLTVVTAEWLLAAGAQTPAAEDLAPRVVEWGRTGRGIGRATHAALANYAEGLAWFEAAVPSAGNGGAMRAAPYGLRYAGQPDEMRYAAALGTAVTHADATAVASAIVQAAAVNICLVSSPADLDPESFLTAVAASVSDLTLPRVRRRSDGQERTLLEQVEEVHECLGRPLEDAMDHFYNGAFVMETTPAVLWLLLTYPTDPEEALVAAVMAGYDADTNAAILGNLVGALHGVDALPKRWVGDELEERDRLVELADDLYAARWA